jgi:hypothetical protein
MACSRPSLWHAFVTRSTRTKYGFLFRKVDTLSIVYLNNSCPGVRPFKRVSPTSDWRCRVDYLDFDLEIHHGNAQQYPVSVVRSPAGEAYTTMHFPFDEPTLESHLKDLQVALLRSGARRRQLPLPEAQVVQSFGQNLFDALFAGEIRGRYDVSLGEATHRGKGLRVRLRIQATELAILPWEYLYDSRRGDFVCFSEETPIVRYLALTQSIPSLKASPPLRVLGMVASPTDLARLDVEHEKELMQEALQGLKVKGVIEMSWVSGQTWRDLQHIMRAGPWHVFHFIGHGGFDPFIDEGTIALADDKGKMQKLNATQLGRLLANHRSLRLVTLNACEGARGGKHDIFSSTASILAQKGIPAVVAMQYEITDRAALEFARTFYGAIADGLTVDAAVTEGRVAMSISLPNTLEWGTPVLYMRASDSLLFDLPQSIVRQEKPPLVIAPQPRSPMQTDTSSLRSLSPTRGPSEETDSFPIFTAASLTVAIAIIAVVIFALIMLWYH